MTSRDGPIPFRHGLAFLGLALGASLLFWGAAALLGAGPGGLAGTILFLAGGAGVPAAVLGLLVLKDTAAARRDYLRRFRPRLLGVRGAALALGLPAAIAAVAGLAGGADPARLQGLLADPLALAGFLAFTLVFGPLPEEAGWRGYALPALQPRLGALAAALAIGAAHAAWHLPLFAIEGTYQADLGVGTPAFWRFLATLVFISVVATWLFEATRGSTLSAVLLHFSDNACGEVAGLSGTAEWLRFALWGLLALALVAATRGRLGADGARAAR